MEESEVKCALCFAVCGKDTVKVRQKGLEALIAASLARNDGEWRAWEDKLRENEIVTVHQNCRKQYTRPSSIDAYINAGQCMKPPTPIKTKIKTAAFDFKNRCFYCGDAADEAFIESQYKLPMQYRKRVFQVSSSDFKATVIETAKKRKDAWGKEVKGRIQDDSIDLFTEEAKYHKECLTKFQHVREGAEVGQGAGRRPDTDLAKSMEEIFDFLAYASECQFSVAELIEQAVTGPAPSEKTVISKLREKYKDDICISDTKTKKTVVCLRNLGKKLLNAQWYEQKKSESEDERMRIVLKAADIIRDDITGKMYDTSVYDCSADGLMHAESCFPPTLSRFLRAIILSRKKGDLKTYELKCTAIGHAVVAATRPRSFLSPLHVALGTFIDRKFGSKNVQIILHELGFCASYHESKRFEGSFVCGEEPVVLPDAFQQFVFDNADFNVNTLDGNNTFHSMGGITCVTPSSSVKLPQSVVRMNVFPTANDIIRKTAIQAKICPKTVSESVNLANTELKSIVPSELQKVVPSTSETLWFHGKTNTDADIKGFNGFMELMTKRAPYKTSAILYLPFLNSRPTHIDTVYSSLCTALEKCIAAGQKLCFVTLDQPLYMIARFIIAAMINDPAWRKVIARLGGFHLVMSFLGCKGFIMAGSGLKEVLNCIYGSVTVEKILSGKNFARAVRAHSLVRLALAKILMSNIDIQAEEKRLNELLAQISGPEPPSFETVATDEAVKILTQKMEEKLSSVEKNGPTARLWVQYFRMVTLMQQFIAAERSGNWDLHIETVKNMLPYFHASGHFPYAKACHIYIQDMMQLKDVLSEEERCAFVSQGFFTVRKTDKFWSGAWTDYTIETSLMRPMKSSGGLTRGRGITDSVLGRWVGAAPFALGIIENLEKLCRVYSESGEQHKDYRDARGIRDNSDVQKLDEWFSDNPPFPVTSECVSLSTGIVGTDKTNCYDAFRVGCDILKGVCGKKFGDLKLTRQNRVQNLEMVNHSFKVLNSDVTCDPLRLFQRISVCLGSQEDLQNYFQYELSPYPLALFDQSGMRKTKKASLYTIFEKKPESTVPTDSFYVIDGGWLLHRVVWPSLSTYEALTNVYVSYLNKHFGKKCFIVFDGYSESATNTKIAERDRRYARKVIPDVVVDEKLNLTLRQDLFLSNSKNKSKLIKLLASKFNKSGLQTEVADGDADQLIVQTAIDVSKKEKHCVIVGEDIDLLVILTALVPSDSEILFLKPGRGKVPTTLFSSQSLDGKPILKKHILLIHAFSGCDTTSACFGKGTSALCKLVQQKKNVEEAASHFQEVGASPEVIAAAGKQLFLKLYGAAEKLDSLNEHRYLCFKKNALRSNTNLLSSLPPTEDAARLHSFRVYHQVQSWLTHELPPQNWGWRLEPRLTPIHSTLDPAPKNILESIFCGCTKGCNRACGCRKTGLRCSNVCINCNGVSCENSTHPEVDDDGIAEEEDVEAALFDTDDDQSNSEFQDGEEEEVSFGTDLETTASLVEKPRLKTSGKNVPSTSGATAPSTSGTTAPSTSGTTASSTSGGTGTIPSKEPSQEVRRRRKRRLFQ